ncbi:MAG TPA: class I SAM-dependent methyltransferase [Halococcus sp.]|nr:class I SAM-dependent methyltransferase [Halococcus sp.]
MTTDPDRPVALAAYESLADDFAERAPERPWNADLERPATTNLLPDIEGQDVLDAGCGPGITTTDLVGRGANVVGVDVSPRMLSNACERIETGADFVRLDLGSSFPFAANSFDLVHASLCFSYVRDWDTLFSELARVLRTEGIVVFSVGHPFADAVRLDPDDYFQTEAVTETWDGLEPSVEMTFFRRSLEETIAPLFRAGFVLDRLVETKPTEQFSEKDPETYERVSREPTFLALRARRS